MSFGKYVFSIGFIQKTIDVDLHVRFNRTYPQRNRHQKTLEDSRGLRAKAKRQRLPGGVGQPHLYVGRPLGSNVSLRIAMSVLHHLLGCFYAIP